MTGFLPEKEFSRRSLLKGGGALVVGFSVLGSSLAGKASTAVNPFVSNPIDQYAIDSWITIHADNTATLLTGGIRQGTGSDTAVLMIAGEELNMNMDQLKFAMADTAVTPNTGPHFASNTVSNTGAGVRAAAASAAQVLLGLASAKLSVPVASLKVSGGVVSGGGSTVTYGELLGGKLFSVQMPASWNLNATPSATGGSFAGPTPTNAAGQGIAAGQAPAKPVSQYKLVGTSPPRIDIPGIVTGTGSYIQDVRMPGMLHGRIVRPRGQAVYGFGAPIVSVDESSIAHIPNARVVRINNFLGVVAPQEYDAIRAAGMLKVKWADPPAVLPGGGDEFARMRALDAAGKTVTMPNASSNDRGDVDAALASAAHVVTGEYGFPTLAQTPLGTMAAVADVTAQGALIFSGTQGPYNTQPDVALALNLPLNLVRVIACAMGGCFGNGTQYNDTAVAAALMSRAVGAPVRVLLMRWDEMGWTRPNPAALMDVRAGVDSSGNLVAMDVTNIYPQGIATRWPSASLADPTGTPQPTPAARRAYAPVPMYNLPNSRYTVKSIQITGNWITGAQMRAVGAHATVFAGEQAIDELAYTMKMDPVAFRIQNVVRGNDWAKSQNQDQLLAVLNAVTKAAGWTPRVSASNLSDANVVRGRGVAWQNAYSTTTMAQTAAIADVEVNKKTGHVAVKHVYHAMSQGLAVYPGGIENQIVGGTVQAVSWILREQLIHGRTNVASSDFVTYPLLRFKDAPQVTPIVVQWDTYSDKPFGAGVGELPVIAVPAAVANAFFDATGVRMRTAPLTPARVRAVLKAAAPA